MRKIFMGLMALLLATPASAAESKFDSTHGAWNVFTSGKGADTVCYITSSPKKEDGNFKKRGEPYVLVTARKDGTVEVSVSSGYPYKQGSLVDIAIDKANTFKLFTTDETAEIAWARSSDEDKKLASGMQKGNDLSVKGYSRKGSYSLDTYSLSGVTAAYKRMAELCK